MLPTPLPRSIPLDLAPSPAWPQGLPCHPDSLAWAVVPYSPTAPLAELAGMPADSGSAGSSSPGRVRRLALRFDHQRPLPGVRELGVGPRSRGAGGAPTQRRSACCMVLVEAASRCPSQREGTAQPQGGGRTVRHPPSHAASRWPLTSAPLPSRPTTPLQTSTPARHRAPLPPPLSS